MTAQPIIDAGLNDLLSTGAVYAFVDDNDGEQLADFLGSFDWDEGQVAAMLADCDPDDLAATIEGMDDAQLQQLMTAMDPEELAQLLPPEALRRLRGRVRGLAGRPQPQRSPQPQRQAQRPPQSRPQPGKAPQRPELVSWALGGILLLAAIAAIAAGGLTP